VRNEHCTVDELEHISDDLIEPRGSENVRSGNPMYVSRTKVSAWVHERLVLSDSATLVVDPDDSDFDNAVVACRIQASGLEVKNCELRHRRPLNHKRAGARRRTLSIATPLPPSHFLRHGLKPGN
jgi:hypothetical protein